GENIFVVRDGVIATPDLSTSILPGITRDTVGEIARSLGYEVVEKSLIRSDLYLADEVFMCGTAAEVTPLRSVDGVELGVGPVTEAIRDEVAEQVRKSVEMGARVLTGGSAPDRPGWYYTPTILTDIPKDSPAYTEEVFGPVALLHRVPDADAAVRLANDTQFGLGSSVWTRDAAEARRFTDELEAGMV
ncbi:aldehyde dehydrogenase family protein, partial [Bradyrhizobium sp. NBAIM08]|uniref:aldehyde dehydrogenase family protein n=1 Tax=Bradyrhizobium sp. NBAIM08 TaxID=2793815 RepID=UPI001CD543E6